MSFRGVAPVPSVVAAVEDLDPASRALLDLSIRWGMDDEQIAAAGGHASIDELSSMRAETVQLVTAGADIAPADEVAEVRRALAHLYAETTPVPVIEDEPGFDNDLDLAAELALDLEPETEIDLEALSEVTVEELTEELEEILRR